MITLRYVYSLLCLCRGWRRSNYFFFFFFFFRCLTPSWFCRLAIKISSKIESRVPQPCLPTFRNTGGKKRTKNDKYDRTKSCINEKWLIWTNFHSSANYFWLRMWNIASMADIAPDETSIAFFVSEHTSNSRFLAFYWAWISIEKKLFWYKFPIYFDGILYILNTIHIQALVINNRY